MEKNHPTTKTKEEEYSEYYDEEESYYSDEIIEKPIKKSTQTLTQDKYTVLSDSLKSDDSESTFKNTVQSKIGNKLLSTNTTKGQSQNKQIYAVTEPKLSSRNFNKSPRSPINRNNTFSSDEDFDYDQYEEYVSALAEKNQLPTDEYIESIEEYINQCIPKAIEHRNYKAAKRYQQASQNLQIITKSQAADVQYGSKDKLLFAQNKIREINEKYDKLIRHKIAEFNVLKNQLNEKFSQEDQEFEEKWNSPQQINPFAKPSRQLLDLRIVENKYAEAGMFDDAEAMRIRADRLEAQETKEARQQLFREMQKAFESLKANQNKQIEGLNDYKDREIHNLEIKRQKELNGVEKFAKRPDVANPAPKIRDAKLYKPRQKRYDIEIKSYTLNLGKFNLRQVIHPDTNRSPRSARRSPAI